MCSHVYICMYNCGTVCACATIARACLCAGFCRVFAISRKPLSLQTKGVSKNRVRSGQVGVATRARTLIGLFMQGGGGGGGLATDQVLK